MDNLFEDIVKKLVKRKETISFMESCTGGLIASLFTDIDGSSNIFNLGLVTYSNEEKIKFGVNKDIIEEYSVYSSNVAKEMAFNICKIANSVWGIGITGQLGTKDPKNNSLNTNIVYFCIYNIKTNSVYNYTISPNGNNKHEKKNDTARFICEQFNRLI